MAKKKSSDRSGFSLRSLFPVAVGMALGSAITIAVMPDKQSITSTETVEIETVSQQAETNNNETTKFEFYSELTKAKQDVSKVEEQAAPAQAKPIAIKTDSKPNQQPVKHYQVQAGVFENQRDADGIRAKLSLNGLDARIEASKLNRKQNFRVVLGPYKNRQAAERTQNQLNNIIQTRGALVIKNAN